MSLLHIVIDEDSYGCAVVLSTALPVQILSQWIDTVCDKLASVHRLHLSRKNFEQLCIKNWYIIRFEIIHISEKNMHSVDDVYDLFFARTVMDEWLCNSDRHSEKRLRKIGSLNDDNHRLISTEELISLNEVSGFILAEKARRDRCMLEFRQYRCNEAVIRWEVLQALSDKYGYGGGRWILTPISYDDAQESSKNVQCMASELLKSFLCGELAEEFVTAIIYRNAFRFFRSTISIVNAFTKFNGLQHMKDSCIEEDQEVDRVLNILVDTGVAREDRLQNMRYKPKICSVCHITRQRGFVPYIYDVTFREGLPSQRRIQNRD